MRLLLLLPLLLAPVHAFGDTGASISALDGSAVMALNPPSSSLPDIEEDPSALFAIVYDMVVNGDWWGAAGIALFAGMTVLVRRRGERWPWLRTPWGYALSTFVLGFLGGCANALFAGQEPSWGLMLTALKVAISALLTKGIFLVYGQLQPKPEAAPTPSAPPGPGAA